jgi:uncharacterized protein YutE (UPF0331/DUF86 family)
MVDRDKIEGLIRHPDDFTRRMQELAGLRNLLVHVYWEVDDQMVYEGIRGELGDFETFVGHIMAYLVRTGRAA